MTPESTHVIEPASASERGPLLTPRDREDIQAIALFGTSAAHLRYHFLAIEDAARARDFVGSLLEPGPLIVNTAGAGQTAADREHLVYVAFTWPGLRALGLDEASLASFPPAFREGARRRSPALGGVTAEDARTWTIADDVAHLVVMLYCREKQTLFEQSTTLIARARRNGCGLVAYVDADALPDGTHAGGQRLTRQVHFGFSDGISQPTIRGAEREAIPGPPPSEPGAFILGHGDPSHPETNHPPLNPPELGCNGTFGAFRIFEQDCDAFEDFLDRQSTDTESRELLAARMCGRWRNGIPLALSPTEPHAPGLTQRDQLNDFDYVPTAERPLAPNDARGLRCPLGSHVRRANPRSGEILGNMGNTIRLIRRGMPYGPPHVRGDGKKRGMLGLFLCGSLEHQFEFVMRHWINDGLFARGLDPAEQDPLFGAAVDGRFTHRTRDGALTIGGLNQLVTTRGAAYLFFPARTALERLARGAVVPTAVMAPVTNPPIAPPAKAAPAPPAPPDPAVDPIGFIVDNIRQRLGRQPFRDAHPRHHGLVRAEFRVLGIDEVDQAERSQRESLCQGLFSTPRTYTAYIRFSNGSPARITPDIAPDIRGMAIKLFNVIGDKLIPDERLTHDFVLASYPRFFVKNLPDYPVFLQMRDPIEKMRRFPLLQEALRSHENPLTMRYFSQTPYRCGPHEVKYCVVPEDPAEVPPIDPSSQAAANREPNYLQSAMADTLASQDVTMRFTVQRAPEGADVDDATALWTSPFTAVALIRIPRQEFRSIRQMALAEDLSFNPWHAIDDHRPLGSINEARLQVYRAVSELRHRNGNVPMVEPDGTEI